MLIKNVNIVTSNYNSQVHIQDFLEYIFMALKSIGTDASYGIGGRTFNGANIILTSGILQHIHFDTQNHKIGRVLLSTF